MPVGQEDELRQPPGGAHLREGDARQPAGPDHPHRQRLARELCSPDRALDGVSLHRAEISQLDILSREVNAHPIGQRLNGVRD